MIIKGESHLYCDFVCVCPLCTLAILHAFMSLADVFSSFISFVEGAGGGGGGTFQKYHQSVRIELELNCL